MIIGLTGGIGSGKTAASDFFQDLGITVVDADLASRVVVEKGREELNKIADHFGIEILTQDGELDRAKLREIIFNSEEEKLWLESLLHPAIASQIQKELDQSQSPYTILVSPLLLETDQRNFCSKVLVVDVPVEVQIKRTSDRDNVSEEQIKSIIASQIDRKSRLQQADEVILNDGSIEDLESKVKELHEKLLSS